MGKYIQMISSLLIAFLVVFATSERNITSFHETQLETSSEKHWESSTQRGAAQLSQAVQWRFARQLKNSIRYPVRLCHGHISPTESIIKKFVAYKVSNNVVRTVLSTTTVLRI